MPSTLLTSIDRQVAADADAPALLDGSGALSRSALQGQSRRVAAALAAAGVLPGDAVAIAIPRSVASVVAVVGVLRAVAGYVPIDPAHPIERQRWIADNAACKAVLVEGAGPEGLSPALDLSRLPDAPAVSDRAEPTGRLNLLYTSGSTGRPKGVIGTQAAMQNRVDWSHAALPFQLGEVAGPWCRPPSRRIWGALWRCCASAAPRGSRWCPRCWQPCFGVCRPSVRPCLTCACGC